MPQWSKELTCFVGGAFLGTLFASPTTDSALYHFLTMLYATLGGFVSGIAFDWWTSRRKAKRGN